MQMSNLARVSDASPVSPAKKTQIPSGGRAVAPPPDRLDLLVQGLQDLTQSSGTHEESAPAHLPHFREEMTAALGGAVLQVAAKVRSEITLWDDALESLQRLSECRFLPRSLSLADF